MITLNQKIELANLIMKKMIEIIKRYRTYYNLKIMIKLNYVTEERIDIILSNSIKILRYNPRRRILFKGGKNLARIGSHKNEIIEDDMKFSYSFVDYCVKKATKEWMLMNGMRGIEVNV